MSSFRSLGAELSALLGVQVMLSEDSYSASEPRIIVSFKLPPGTSPKTFFQDMILRSDEYQSLINDHRIALAAQSKDTELGKALAVIGKALCQK